MPQNLKRRPLLEKTNIKNLNMAEKTKKISEKSFASRTRSVKNKENSTPKVVRNVKKEQFSPKNNRVPLVESDKVLKVAPNESVSKITRDSCDGRILGKVLNVSLEYNPEVEKIVQDKFSRIASKRAKILLEKLNKSSPVTPKTPETKFKLSSEKDVYEFTFDPNEEPEILKKRKKLKQILENSDDLNNSMKDVVRKMRKKEFDNGISKISKKVPKSSKKVPACVASTKVSRSASKGTRGSKKASNLEISDNVPQSSKKVPKEGSSISRSVYGSKKVSNLESSEKVPGRSKKVPIVAESSKKSSSTSKRAQGSKKASNLERSVKVLQSSKKVPSTIEESSKKVPLSEGKSISSHKSISNAPNIQVSNFESPRTRSSKKVAQFINPEEKELLKSSIPFTLDASGPEISLRTRSSKKVAQSALSSEKVLESSILGETTSSFVPIENLTLSESIIQSFCEEKSSKPTQKSADTTNPWRLNVVNHNPHTFIVKNDSFTPSYDQDIVISSTLVEKFPKKKSSVKQTSILNFVSESSKNVINTTLFMSPKKISPPSHQKVLTDFNFQSTPYNCNQHFAALDISRIENVNESRHQKSHDNLFGFTIEEEEEEDDKENLENVEVTPLKNTSKKSKKRSNLKKVLFNEDVVKIDEEKEDEVPEISSQDVEMLFQDIEDDKKLEVKKSRFSYERPRRKRKRYPSWNESEVENEESEGEIEPTDVKKITPKKHNKTKYKRTKQDEEEIDRLAAHYNSMFEEIEHHDLLVE